MAYPVYTNNRQVKGCACFHFSSGVSSSGNTLLGPGVVLVPVLTSYGNL